MSMLFLVAIAAVVAGGLWLLRWETTAQRAYPDTFWYTRQAAMMAGVSSDRAEELAARTTCQQGLPELESWPNCEDGLRAYAAGLPDRYSPILDTRPGYPLVAAPFVAVFHEQGMTMATTLLGVGAGVLAALVVRLLGGSAAQALFATALLLLLPTGYWVSRLLSEAGVVTAALATLCAVTVVLRGERSQRTRFAAAAVAAIGLIVTILMKPSSGVLLGAAIGGAAVFMIGFAVLRRQRADLTVVTLAGVCFAVVMLWQALATLLDLPGLQDTVQDMFTYHFTQPDVSQPWTRLWEANVEYWPAQFDLWLNGGVPLAASPVLAVLVACRL